MNLSCVNPSTVALCYGSHVTESSLRRLAEESPRRQAAPLLSCVTLGGLEALAQGPQAPYLSGRGGIKCKCSGLTCPSLVL